VRYDGTFEYLTDLKQQQRENGHKFQISFETHPAAKDTWKSFESQAVFEYLLVANYHSYNCTELDMMNLVKRIYLTMLHLSQRCTH
jgi:hypothetical protein